MKDVVNNIWFVVFFSSYDSMPYILLKMFVTYVLSGDVSFRHSVRNPSFSMSWSSDVFWSIHYWYHNIHVHIGILCILINIGQAYIYVYLCILHVNVGASTWIYFTKPSKKWKFSLCRYHLHVHKHFEII